MFKKTTILLSALMVSVCLGVSGLNAQEDLVRPEKISENGITLDIHFHFHNRRERVYDSSWPVEVHASQLTGISLNNLTSMDVKNGKEAFNILIANGDLPDIIGGTEIRDKFNQYGPLGYLQPLNDLIDKHAPNIKSFFDENPNLLKAISAADGNLYHIPYVPEGKFGRAYFIRADWLKKLNLETPETVDDLYEVLKAFKTRDPNGNGLADEIPLFYRQSAELARLVLFWGGRTTGSDTYHDFYVENGDIKHGYTEEAYRDGIRNISKWFDEGLIDQQVFEREGDIRVDMLGNDIGGMTHDWFASTSGYNSKLKDRVPDIEFLPIAPPASISGKQVEEHHRAAVKPDGWAISKSNVHAVATIKYFDFWFSPYGRRLANFGIEGSEYTLVDGKPVFTDDVLNGDIPVNARLWSIGAQIPRGYVMDYDYERQWTNEIALQGIEMYEKGDYLVEPYLGVALNQDEKETMDNYWSEILLFMLERQEEWILGLRDVDKDWDSYKSRLDKLGLQRVLRVMQSAYSRQYNLTAELQD